MEIHEDVRSSIAAGLGPRPTTEAAPAPPALSKPRAALLTTLRAASHPMTLTALGTMTGLHVNTVREHLAALTSAGLVERGLAAPVGRGRPSATYTAAAPVPTHRGAEHAGLARALAATIHRTSSAPSEDAAAAGAEWGRDLARDDPAAGPSDVADPRGRAVRLLDRLGFAPRPEADGGSVLLTRCPLLETAQAYPGVVCAVHLGIVRGALEEYGAQDVGAELHPFSDPGACRLVLTGPRSRSAEDPTPEGSRRRSGRPSSAEAPRR